MGGYGEAKKSPAVRKQRERRRYSNQGKCLLIKSIFPLTLYPSPHNLHKPAHMCMDAPTHIHIYFLQGIASPQMLAYWEFANISLIDYVTVFKI